MQGGEWLLGVPELLVPATVTGSGCGRLGHTGRRPACCDCPLMGHSCCGECLLGPWRLCSVCEQPSRNVGRTWAKSAGP